MKYEKFRNMETMNEAELKAAIEKLETAEKLEFIQGALDHEEVPYVNLVNVAVVYSLVTLELSQKVSDLEKKLKQVEDILEWVPAGNTSFANHKDFQIEAISNLFIDAPYNPDHDGTN